MTVDGAGWRAHDGGAGQERGSARDGLVATFQARRGDFELDVELDIDRGEVIVLLGPNGAGKTTLLNTLAGMRPPTAGHIELAGRVLDDPASGVHVPKAQRGVGLVVQDFLLFPRMSAVENVAFGLRARGMRRRKALEVADGWLDRMGLRDLRDRRPAELSGGQSQRVALARALIVEPSLLLLDEPLAALDAGTRPAVRAELRRHLGTYTGCTVVVTHDPLEAMLLGHRVVVLEAGRIVQAGPPDELARHPRTDYVARLVGLNLHRGLASGHDVRLAGGAGVVVPHEHAGSVYVAFPPTAVMISRERPHGSARNAWLGQISDVEVHGDLVRLTIDGDVPMLADVTPLAVADLDLTPGVRVWAAVKASEISVYPA